MRVTALLLGVAISFTAAARPSVEYLPDGASMDDSIPPPEAVFGWEPGDWRVHHADLVRYMYALSDASERVSIKVTGRTWEQRPLLQLVITSPANQQNIEALRQAHLRAADRGEAESPLVVWLGYSVHGDEASGSNAAPIVAWYLAASQSEYVLELLEDTVVIIDPNLNPDGLDRFASWSNANRSVTPVADRNGRIHHQGWPAGRTNHYLFDLNRDWLPAVHPESRARLTEYHRWLPHVITDHHETRTDGFFFQPGAPTRQHPLTTPGNLEMTRKLAAYHADSFNKAGVLYFTEDFYDDFYFGKGSTYPDINGSIGILFEQPRVQGELVNRDSGPLAFSDAIQNQVYTSLSTLRGSHELRDELQDYQAGFFREMRRRAGDAGFRAWVIGDNGDPARAGALLEVLDYHQVEYRVLDARIEASGQVFLPGHAWVIPADQRQFGLIQAALETRTAFEDNTFYDVSAWNLAMAHDLPLAQLGRMPATRQATPRPESEPRPGAVAWVVPWSQLEAPRVLQQLLTAGARVRAATRPFSMPGGASFGAGSLVVISGIQDAGKRDEVHEILQQSAENMLEVHSFDSLVAETGPGLGTEHFEAVPPLRPLLVTGPGTRMYDAGEAWFTLDVRLGVPPVMVDMARLSSVDLDDYTHLLLVDGGYSDIGKGLQQRIGRWITGGGVLVAVQNAATWAEGLCFGDGDCAPQEDDPADSGEEPAPMAYGDFDDQRAQRLISGAIVTARVDNTHPVAYGLAQQMPVFRRGATLLEASENPFATPLRYTDDPLVSGFIGEERLEQMKGQPAVIAERHGQGLVVRFANNPLFRGFWRGTERAWVNALFFGPLVDRTQLPE